MNSEIESKSNPNNCSWINPKLELHQSLIEGEGYFAREKIAKDEKLIVQSGCCIHISLIDTKEMEPLWYYGFQIENDIYYYPLHTDSGSALDGIFRINHSCEPNTGFRGQITLVAMRDIEPGEEITYDYAMTDLETDQEDPWVPEKCKCSNKTCRNYITGSDWKLAELHKKYSGYFSTHVAKLIEETLN